MGTTVDGYARFAAMGAVLDIVRLPISLGSTHEAALQGMRVIAERYRQRFAALNPGRDPSTYFHISIDSEVESGRRILVGEEITVQELFGPGYGIESDEIRLFRYSPGCRSTVVSEGLAHALLNPPYTLRGPDRNAGPLGSPGYAARETAWLRDVLRAFCAEVLALDDPRRASHLRVLCWQTDWSNYFDAGRDWWGTFYWSIEDTRNEWITIIAASSSD